MSKTTSLQDCYKQLTSEARVLDVGCLGFSQQKMSSALRPGELHHFGVDYCNPEALPPNFTFKKADLNKSPIPFEDDFFDLVVASHVIEHMKEPLDFFKECLRVCKPGGLLYVEAPSERSLMLPGMPFDHDKFLSLSFYDDPTHMSRPWSPQAFFRLTKLYSCDPLKADYITSGKRRLIFPLNLLLAFVTKNGKMLEKCLWRSVGWASFLIARKPLHMSGTPPFNYYVPKQ